jgi:hypothetical protein
VLLAGSTDGVRRVTGLSGGDAATERVLASRQVMRLRTFESVPGAFAATTGGLYHTRNGTDWTDLGVPADAVYSVGAADDGTIYAGTRPARVYETSLADDGTPGAWRECEAFRAAGERDDWGIDRHENIAQVRDVQVAAADPNRLVAGVEVGGVYVSDDRGETWNARRIDGFDAPHTDDIHHVATTDGRSIVAATGSGLYRTTDAGRSWTRLDEGYRQSYFREALVHDGVVYAGGSPAPPSSWDDDPDHELFVAETDGALDPVESPRPAEVAVGWTVHDGDPLAVTNHGTLLWRRDGWTVAGNVPAPESVHGRCVPLLSL